MNARVKAALERLEETVSNAIVNEPKSEAYVSGEFWLLKEDIDTERQDILRLARELKRELEVENEP